MASQDSSDRRKTGVPVSSTLVVDTDSESALDSAVDKFSPRGSLKRVAYVLVNVWLVFHLFCVAICPASVEPASPLVQDTFEFVSPYLHLLYLDHGFHFFAPEPGGSTLVAYTAELPDGSTKTGRFPDRQIFPRLFYHRHFMLTEFLGNGPEELQPYVERAFARNLCRVTGANRVSLTKVEHETASVEEIRRGLSLNDPSLFKETSLGTYTAEELQLPFKPPTKESPTDKPASEISPSISGESEGQP